MRLMEEMYVKCLAQYTSIPAGYYDDCPPAPWSILAGKSSQTLLMDSCIKEARGLSTGMMLLRDAQSLDDEET